MTKVRRVHHSLAMENRKKDSFVAQALLGEVTRARNLFLVVDEQFEWKTVSEYKALSVGDPKSNLAYTLASRIQEGLC